MTIELAQRFAEALQSKGWKAFFGPYWDGAHDASHDAEPNFWYFHPRSNGGVGAYVQYAYEPETIASGDTGFIEPEEVEEVLARVMALGVNPTRKDVWKAIEGEPV